MREVVGDDDVAKVRLLMEAYGAHLAAHPAGVAKYVSVGVS